MSTTIQIEEEVKEKLARMKLTSRETYNDVIERILEDLEELDERTKKDIMKALKEIEKGKFKTHEQLGKEMGF